MPVVLLPRPTWTPMPTIHPWSHESIGPMTQGFGVPASAAYPTANKAFYVPFTIPANIVVVKLFLLNGATASGNFDLGIYDAVGNRRVSSGSTAQSGTNVVQAVDITDTVLSGPALYYMAVAFDGTTGTLFRTAVNPSDYAGGGILQQTTAFALPNPATFATSTAAYVPMIGVSMRALLD